jgi:hypothetical protein
VGMPFGEPGADWLLLGPDVELRHTAYDLARAAERIRATTYPEDFAARYVLNPPAAAQMLEVFTAFSLKGRARAAGNQLRRFLIGTTSIGRRRSSRCVRVRRRRSRVA